MASGGQILSSEEAFDYNCIPCSEQERFVEAKRFCVECGEYFCSTCLSYHQKFSATKEHTLVKCEGVTKHHFPTRFSKCDIHTDKEEDMVCCDHLVVGCRVCITKDHRSCQNIDYLPRLAQKYKEEEKRVELDKDMRVKIQDIRAIQNENTYRVLKLKGRTTTDLKRLEALKKSVTECVDNVITNAEKDIKYQFGPEIYIMQGHIEKYNELLSELNRLSIALSNENDDIGVCKKVLECKRKLNTIQIKSCVFDDKIPIYEKVQNDIVKAIDSRLIKGEQLFHTSEHLDIPGLCVKESDPSTSVYIADFHNNKIRQVGCDLNVFKTFAVEGSIWGICEMSKHELAFTLPSLKKVQFISIHKNQDLETSFNTTFNCRGIACYDSHIYVIGIGGTSGDRFGQLHVFGMRGKLLHRHTGDFKGTYFSIPHSIIVNSEGIYITDQQKGVICLDLKGKRKWVCNNTTCKIPWGICFTPNGNLFVSGHESNNIVIISKDGEFLGELLDNNCCLSKPKALGIDKRNNCIIVSELDKPHLKMFYISDSEM